MSKISFPLTHFVPVANLRPDGLQVIVETTKEQREAIAQLLDLPSVEALEGLFTLTPRKKGLVDVRGTVKGAVHQTCVVTLEAFACAISQDVELEFAPPDAAPIAKAASEPDLEDFDPPDLIIDGHIDLGAVTVEFLALALDPFPRKPDAVFDYKDPNDEKENPFAGLVKLMPKE